MFTKGRGKETGKIEVKIVEAGAEQEVKRVKFLIKI